MSNPLLPSATHTHTVAQISNDNLAAGALPTATDDANSGYERASLWVVPSTNTPALCTDATAGNAKWTYISPLGAMRVWIFADNKSNGSSGGAIPANNTWYTRTLNSTDYSSGSDVTLSANAITLQPNHNYFVYARTPLHRLTQGSSSLNTPIQARLLDSGQVIVYEYGSNMRIPAISGNLSSITQYMTDCIVFTWISPTVATSMFVQQRISTTSNLAQFNLGLAMSIGTQETYTTVFVLQVS